MADLGQVIADAREEAAVKRAFEMEEYWLAQRQSGKKRGRPISVGKAARGE